MTAATTVVQLHGVARTYPGPPMVAALRATNLFVQRGAWVTVTGRSGSGKSTLLNLLGLLDRPSAGRYVLDGTDTAGMTDIARTRLRGQRIGFVFQSFHLMPYRPAWENVVVALIYARTHPRRQWRHMAFEALERVGLSHRAHALPGTLSGGERQRVAIARALVTRPALLLADEPTGNLDSTTTAEVLSYFDELNRDGQTMVVVTHDSVVASRAQRRLDIEDGILVEPVSAS